MQRKQKNHDPEKKSSLERAFETLYIQYGSVEDTDMPELHWQFTFHPVRDWEFDYAHIATKTAIELDGGEWFGSKGGHTSGTGKQRDCEKQNAAMLLGWAVIRFTSDMLRDDPLGGLKLIVDVIAMREDTE